MDESLSENADENTKKHMFKVVASEGAKGVSRNELTSKMQFIHRSMREEYSADLMGSDEVVAREIVMRRNRTSMLFLATYHPQN